MSARLTPRALADLRIIRDYLEPLSPKGAERVRLAILNTVQLLAQFPRCGRATDIPEIRMITAMRYPYLLYHTATDDEAVIVHIRHASRAAPTAEDLQP